MQFSLEKREFSFKIVIELLDAAMWRIGLTNKDFLKWLTLFGILEFWNYQNVIFRKIY